MRKILKSTLFIIVTFTIVSCFSTFQSPNTLPKGTSRHLVGGEGAGDYDDSKVDVLPDAVYKYRRGISDKLELGYGFGLIMPRLTIGGKYQLMKYFAVDGNASIATAWKIFPERDFFPGYNMSAILGDHIYLGVSVTNVDIIDEKLFTYPFVGAEIEINKSRTLFIEFSFPAESAWNAGVGYSLTLN